MIRRIVKDQSLQLSRVSRQQQDRTLKTEHRKLYQLGPDGLEPRASIGMDAGLVEPG